MKAVLLFTLLIVGTFCITFSDRHMRQLYSQWKSHHKKLYSSRSEDQHRFSVFSQNYKKIVEYNRIQSDVKLGLNKFADLTSAEFKNLYTGFVPKGANKNADGVAPFRNLKDLPASVDWRTEGAVTAVKDQGMCGSCWAFSATGALEGLYFTKNQKLVSFSEQNLVDCVTVDDGCDGGLMSDAFDYTAKGGINSEDDYPYAGVDQTCAFDQSNAYITNNGYLNVTAKNPTALKEAIVVQPVSVAIEADQFVFQFYQGGVIKALCGNDLDHGVLAVGYDVIGGTEAFIVKNSWGDDWGVNGYVYISTDGTANKGDGVCGILAMASYPLKRC